MTAEPLTDWWMFLPVWQFAVDDGGAPSVARATVAEAPPCGQAVSADASFLGTVGSDVTAPSFGIVTEPLFEGVALPWDAVAVGASEGVDPDAWQAAVSATLDASPITLVPAAIEGTSETNRLELSAEGWIERNGRVLHVEVSSGVADRSGNASARTSFEHVFAEVSAPVREVTFDGTTVPLIVGMQVQAAGDSPCESDASCAASLDGQHVVGLAARLDTAGADSVVVRYSDWYAPPLEATLVLPSGQVVPIPVGPRPSVDNQADSWRELEIVIPDAADEVALTLRWKGYECTGTGPGGGVGQAAIGSITVR